MKEEVPARRSHRRDSKPIVLPWGPIGALSQDSCRDQARALPIYCPFGGTARATGERAAHRGCPPASLLRDQQPPPRRLPARVVVQLDTLRHAALDRVAAQR